MSFRSDLTPTGLRDAGSRVRRALVVAAAGATLVVFTLTGCEDDPILSPENVDDTGTGGSYGRLEVPGERAPHTGPPSRAGGAARSGGEGDGARIGDERDRPENPERF